MCVCTFTYTYTYTYTYVYKRETLAHAGERGKETQGFSARFTCILVNTFACVRALSHPPSLPPSIPPSLPHSLSLSLSLSQVLKVARMQSEIRVDTYTPETTPALTRIREVVCGCVRSSVWVCYQYKYLLLILLYLR
jgi:hypothetical protein